MSLIYQGNAVKGLGEYFPAIIIDKIYVKTGTLTLHYSIFFPAFDYEAPSTEYLTNIQNNLNFYAVGVSDSNNAESVIAGDISVLSCIQHDFPPVSYAFTTFTFGLTNYLQLTPDFTNTTPELLYDSSENMLFKYSFEAELEPFQNPPGYVMFTTFENFFSQATGYLENQFLTVFCFATPYDVSDTGAGNQFTVESWTEFTPAPNTSYSGTGPGHTAYLPYAPLPLIKRNIGDVTYENVFMESKINTDFAAAYTDPEGTYFDETPLMALNAKYYKPITITHEDIVENINLLLEGFEPNRESEIKLAGVVDSISYALGVYGTKVDLLYQLNQIRKAFPERGGATKTGRLYGEYSKAIAGINDKIRSNPVLKKVLYRNPKIIDSRVGSTISTSWTPPTTTTDAGEEVIYPHSLKSKKAYGYPGVLGESGYSTLNRDVSCVNWGYFFFDLEKVLHKDTYIAQILDVTKIDKLFGIHLMNAGVKLKDILFYRSDIDSSTLGLPQHNMSMAADFQAASPSTQYNNRWPAIKKIDWTLNSYYSQGDRSYGSVTLPNESTAVTYVAPRAFQIASSDGLYSADFGHDYRLMCFEFEDYYEIDIEPDGSPVSTVGEGGTGSDYDIEITVWDYSLDILDYLRQKLSTVVQGFSDYYDLAGDHCNYNNENSYFNAFFTDSMKATYANDLSQAPWTQMATMFEIYTDLLDTASNKTIEEIIEAAALQDSKMSPYEGTLEQIGIFLSNAQALESQLDDTILLIDDSSEIPWSRDLAYTQNLDLTQAQLYIGIDLPEDIEYPPRADAPVFEWVRVAGGTNGIDTGTGQAKRFTFGGGFSSGEGADVSNWIEGQLSNIAAPYGNYGEEAFTDTNGVERYGGGMNDYNVKWSSDYKWEPPDWVESHDHGTGYGEHSAKWYRSTDRTGNNALEGDQRIWGYMVENPPRSELDAVSKLRYGAQSWNDNKAFADFKIEVYKCVDNC